LWGAAAAARPDAGEGAGAGGGRRSTALGHRSQPAEPFVPNLCIMLSMRTLSLGTLLLFAVTSAVASDGTAKGTLTVNGKKFPLTNVYARKREAWPVDAERLGAEDVEGLTCGIVGLVATNE